MYVENVTTSEIVSASGTITTGDGSAVESIGYSDASGIISHTGSDSDYFEGDVAEVEVYSKGDLELPT